LRHIDIVGAKKVRKTFLAKYKVIFFFSIILFFIVFENFNLQKKLFSTFLFFGKFCALMFIELFYSLQTIIFQNVSSFTKVKLIY